MADLFSQPPPNGFRSPSIEAALRNVDAKDFGAKILVGNCKFVVVAATEPGKKALMTCRDWPDPKHMTPEGTFAPEHVP